MRLYKKMALMSFDCLTVLINKIEKFLFKLNRSTSKTLHLSY